MIVGGATAIGTVVGAARSYSTALIGERPFANRAWAEKEINDLKVVVGQGQLWYYQNQQAIITREIEQAQYESRQRQAPDYVRNYLKSLRERFDWNQKIIEELLRTGAPSVQRQCK